MSGWEGEGRGGKRRRVDQGAQAQSGICTLVKRREPVVVMKKKQKRGEKRDMAMLYGHEDTRSSHLKNKSNKVSL